jgi:hypothetical protein
LADHSRRLSADLHGAHLAGVDLRGLNLTGISDGRRALRMPGLNNAIYDDTPIWPDGFTPPAQTASAEEPDAVS